MKALVLFLLLFCSFSARSQERLRKPLVFVPADSVMTWGAAGGTADVANLRLLAVNAAPEAVPFVHRLTKKDWKDFKTLAKRWRNELLPAMNAAGGAGDEMREPQTVAAAANYNVAAKLLRMTGHGAYAGAMERALYNALLRAVTDTTNAVGGSIDRRLAAGILFASPGMIYALGDETLYVNFYTNSTARIPWGKRTLTIDQVTHYPAEGEVRLCFNGIGRRKGERIRLLLRLPDWAFDAKADDGLFAVFRPEKQSGRQGATLVRPNGEGIEVRVNGHEVEAKVTPEGYLEIDREWMSQDEVRLVLPMTRRNNAPLLLQPRGLQGRQKVSAMHYGPFVYALRSDAPTPLPDCYYPPAHPAKIAPEATMLGLPAFEGRVYKDRGTPADAAAPAVDFRAVPYAEAPDGAEVWTRFIGY